MAFQPAAQARQASTVAAQSAPPSIAERYQTADAFLGAGIGDLIDNANVAPQFAGNALFYRTGNRKDQRFLLLDLATKQVREVATTASLLAALSEANGRTISLDEARLADIGYDAEHGAIAFDALDGHWRLNAAGKAEKVAPEAP